MMFPTPYSFFVQTAVIGVPNVSTDGNYVDVWDPASTTNTTTMCAVQELSGSERMHHQRFEGQRIARGFFPPEITTMTKDTLFLVTGPGFPSAGTKYRAVSPPTSSAGTDSFWIVEMEAIT